MRFWVYIIFADQLILLDDRAYTEEGVRGVAEVAPDMIFFSQEAFNV